MAWSLEVARQLLEAAAVTTPASRPLVVHEDSWEISHAGQVLALTITQYRLLKELLHADRHTVRTHQLRPSCSAPVIASTTAWLPM
jgi:hypothetical protein